jgi:hypothetical protein
LVQRPRFNSVKAAQVGIQQHPLAADGEDAKFWNHRLNVGLGFHGALISPRVWRIKPDRAAGDCERNSSDQDAGIVFQNVAGANKNGVRRRTATARRWAQINCI